MAIDSKTLSVGVSSPSFEAGLRYYFGNGIEKNLEKAIENFSFAAKQKSGIEFGDRLETPADLTSNGEYYRTKAMNINTDAAHCEALFYELTPSLERSLFKARHCLMQAALHDHELSETRLNPLAPIVPLQISILQSFDQFKLTHTQKLSTIVADFAFEENPRKRPTIKEREI